MAELAKRLFASKKTVNRRMGSRIMSARYRNILLYAFCAAAMLLYGACLDVESSIVIKRNGQVHLYLRYSFDNSLMALGAFDRYQLASLPITEQDFRRIDAFSPSVTLLSYRRKNRRENSEVKARLRFDDINTFNDHLKGFDDTLHTQLMHDARGGRLDILLSKGMDTYTSAYTSSERDDFVLFAREFFDAYTIRIDAHTPQSIITQSDGERIGRRRARYQKSISNLLLAENQVVWSVEW